MFLELIFHLLNIYRKGEAVASYSIRRVLARRLVHPELLEQIEPLSFWTTLCRSAGLLDEPRPPFPTLLAAAWWRYPFVDQMNLLIEGWVKSVCSPHRRKNRRQVLERLRQGEALTRSEKDETNGLRALGLIRDERLTELGRDILIEKRIVAAHTVPERWLYQSERLVVPYPPDWALLWSLEAYLDPVSPGVYDFSLESCQRAVQRGGTTGKIDSHHTETLAAILELGTGEPAPAELIATLAAQPVLRLLPGPLLEVSDPQILKQLRRSASLRPYLEQVVSPRHVHLPGWQAHKILQQLRRLGWEVEETQAGGIPGEGRRESRPFNRANAESSRFSSADKLYLLSLLLFAEGFHAPYAPPPGLLGKLAAGLQPAQLAAAAEHASALLKVLYPHPPWIPEVTPPAPPEPALIDFLQGVIDREESIDILYQTSQKHTPEYRHISPLVLEERNARWYLVAYCHNRRGQRLFRLDRLMVIDEPYASSL